MSRFGISRRSPRPVPHAVQPSSGADKWIGRLRLASMDQHHQLTHLLSSLTDERLAHGVDVVFANPSGTFAAADVILTLGATAVARASERGHKASVNGDGWAVPQAGTFVRYSAAVLASRGERGRFINDALRRLVGEFRRPPLHGIDIRRIGPVPLRGHPILELVDYSVDSRVARLTFRVHRSPHRFRCGVNDLPLKQHDKPDEQQRRADSREDAGDIRSAICRRDHPEPGRDHGKSEHDAPDDPAPPDAQSRLLRRPLGHPTSVRGCGRDPLPQVRAWARSPSQNTASGAGCRSHVASGQSPGRAHQAPIQRVLSRALPVVIDVLPGAHQHARATTELRG